MTARALSGSSARARTPTPLGRSPAPRASCRYPANARLLERADGPVPLFVAVCLELSPDGGGTVGAPAGTSGPADQMLPTSGPALHSASHRGRCARAAPVTRSP